MEMHQFVMELVPVVRESVPHEAPVMHAAVPHLVPVMREFALERAPVVPASEPGLVLVAIRALSVPLPPPLVLFHSLPRRACWSGPGAAQAPGR